MNRTRVASVMSASTALALVGMVPASAHDTATAGSAAFMTYGPTATSQSYWAQLAATHLDALQAKAAALHARVAAIPDDSGLNAGQRATAIRQLKRAQALSRFLGRLEGLTPAQADQVDAIRAELDIAAAELKVLLSNRPASDPVKVVTSDRVVTATDTTREHVCDGDHDGVRRTGFQRDDDRNGDWDRYSSRHHR